MRSARHRGGKGWQFLGGSLCLTLKTLFSALKFCSAIKKIKFVKKHKKNDKITWRHFAVVLTIVRTVEHLCFLIVTGISCVSSLFSKTLTLLINNIDNIRMMIHFSLLTSLLLMIVLVVLASTCRCLCVR